MGARARAHLDIERQPVDLAHPPVIRPVGLLASRPTEGAAAAPLTVEHLARVSLEGIRFIAHALVVVGTVRAHLIVECFPIAIGLQESLQTGGYYTRVLETVKPAITRCNDSHAAIMSSG
eukprot:1194982-Prorocentrum_minimum.AAC.10